jgi:hypothetical protein
MYEKWVADTDKASALREEKQQETDRQNNAKIMNAQRQAKEQEAASQIQITMQVSSAVSAAGLAYVNGQMTAAQAGKTAMRDAGMMAIRMAAAESFVKSVAAYAGIPVVGAAIGVSVGAGLMSMILGYLTKFHTGGVVGSNDGARMPGMASNERMVTVQVGERIQTQQQQRGGGSGMNVTIAGGGIMSRTSAEIKRQVNELSKLQRRQARLGYA